MPVKSGKRCGFVFDSCLKDSAFAAVRRDAKFYTRYVKRVPFLSNKTNAVPFFVSTPPVGFKPTSLFSKNILGVILPHAFHVLCFIRLCNADLRALSRWVNNFF